VSRSLLRTMRPVLLLAALFVTGYVLGTRAVTLFDKEETPASTTSPGAAQLTEPVLVSDFTLTNQLGESMNLSDLRGRAVVMFFGYTHCPDVCPTTLADYRRVKAALGDRAGDVAFVFISVDGSRDSPEVLNQYLASFDPDFIGFTGDEDTVLEIGREYGLMIGRETINVEHEHEDADQEHELNQENYFVQHTSPSFLIDPEGYLQNVLFYGTKPEVIAEAIRTVLAESDL
jgi:protein SCO1/2